MKIEIIIDLKNITKKDLKKIAKHEGLVGGWKAFLLQILELYGMYDFYSDYNIDYKIKSIKEIK